MTTDTPPAEHPQLLTDRLLVWAGGRTPGEQAAVIALIDEDDLLTRRDVQQLLITDNGTTLHCDWPRFETRYRTTLTLDDEEDAFLTLVIATAFPRLVALWKVETLGRRRLAIILRAIEHLATTDTVERPAPRQTIAVCAACFRARISGNAEDTHACHGVTWLRVEGRLPKVGAVANRCPCPCPSGTGRQSIT